MHNLQNMQKTETISPLQRRALTIPETFNQESAEFEVVYATDSPVLMSGWDGAYYEVLKIDGQRMDRIQAGAPFLNNHNASDSVQKSVIGVVTEARNEGGQAIAKIKLSGREEIAGIRQDIAAGILRNISCGYRVYKY